VEKWGYGYGLLFALVMVFGIAIEFYGNRLREREKRILEPKEKAKY